MWGNRQHVGLTVTTLSVILAGCSLVSLDGLSSGTGGAGAQGGGPPLTCDSDQKICDGVCVPIADPETGCQPDSCDPCFANSASACVDGACQFEMCAEGFDDCDDNLMNGCEADLQNDPATCGGCEIECDLANAEAGCALGACTVAACVAPYADCDGMFGNGCESNPTTDEDNCGACEHDCLGGPCGASQCEPVLIASAVGSVGGLVTDGVNVYWTDSLPTTGAVHRIPVHEGGLPPPVESVAINQDYPNDLILVGSTLYWIHTGSTPDTAEIRKTDAGNSAVAGSFVADAASCTSRLAASATHLFWIESGFCYNRLLRIALSGTPASPQVIDEDLGLVWGLAAGPRRAFWSERNTGTISTGSSAANVTLLASELNQPTRLAVTADGRMYFVEDAGTSASISRLDLDDLAGGPTPLATVDLAGAEYVDNLLADEAYVYWTDGEHLRRVSVEGGAVADVAVDGAGKMTQDAVSVYWHDGSSILRIAKPLPPTRR